MIKIIIIIQKRSIVLFPGTAKELESLGSRLKDARLRRRFSMETVCIRADISRPSLYKIKKGDPSVSMGMYAQVLRVLGLVQDLSLVAKDDDLGRRLQNEALPYRKRAPKKKIPQQAED